MKPPEFYMGGCQNYGPLFCPLYEVDTKDPKKDHNVDNHPCNDERNGCLNTKGSLSFLKGSSSGSVSAWGV